MSVRKSHIELLRPFLVGEQPRADGEWDMHCPLHRDGKRSAQLNVEEGVWYCHAGCGGGRVEQLIRARSDWVDPPAASRNGSGSRSRSSSGQPSESVTEAKVSGWTEALMSNEAILDALVTERGLSTDTARRFDLGWDAKTSAYTIPVRAPDGTFWNVRRYQLHPPAGRRKIWSISGMGKPKPYPISVLDDDPKEIVICEGEMDALATIQAGFPAITRTGAAKVWKSEWNKLFSGRVVYLAHDCDTAGQEGNRRVGRALRSIASEIRVLRLPYPIEEKHGKDLSDFWAEYDADEFTRLLRSAEPFDAAAPEPTDLDSSSASVLDSFDARRVGEPLRLTVTIKGKRDPGYSIPKKADLSCTQDAGQKCAACPMNAVGGEASVEIPARDPVVLELTDSTKPQVHDILRRYFGAVKCNRLRIEPTGFQAVEVLFARPSVDHVSTEDASDYKNVKLTSVGRHDTFPNNTVQVVGALHPDPRRQLNEFLAWDVNRMETSLDYFEMDAAAVRLMKVFQARKGQRPLRKLGEIARGLASNVTRIYGRPELHAAIDLVFHSALAFDFDGKRVSRGWLDLLVVGDTRTGKSEVATQLTRYYGAGEIVSCESASFAGIIGGLQQFGASKEWAITWGAIPINDRRLVTLDEVGGLQPEEIAAMSSVRSSGEAQLTKIQQEKTFARTRLIWLGNPRNGRMSDYTYGVQAIAPLIGNPEDIARFDLAMSVRAEEVSAEEINKSRDAGEFQYSQEACHALVRWVWSRKPDQIRWEPDAEPAVFAAANDLGERYIEDPPLVQVANVREKVARVAVALAARLFSTDETGEVIVVRKEHVEDAVAFIDRIYSMRGFGYAERSKEIIDDAKEAKEGKADVKVFLHNSKGLAKFLRSAAKFRRQDLEEIMNIDREQANAIISTLWEAKMVRKDKGDVRVQPALHELLREAKIR